MQVFTNKFSVALNQDKSEVIINFFQNVPIIPTSSDQPKLVREMASEIVPVANIVMTGQCARNFVETLSNMLDRDVPNE